MDVIQEIDDYACFTFSRAVLQGRWEPQAHLPEGQLVLSKADKSVVTRCLCKNAGFGAELCMHVLVACGLLLSLRHCLILLSSGRAISFFKPELVRTPLESTRTPWEDTPSTVAPVSRL